MGPIVVGNDIVEQDADKAEAFADFFESVYASRDGPHPSKQDGASPAVISEELQIDFSPPAVFDKLKALKNKHSITPESLPPVFFKMFADVLCEPLSLIYTAALEEGDVPDLFRESIVVPIFEKGKRQEDRKL